MRSELVIGRSYCGQSDFPSIPESPSIYKSLPDCTHRDQQYNMSFSRRLIMFSIPSESVSASVFTLILALCVCIYDNDLSPLAGKIAGNNHTKKRKMKNIINNTNNSAW